MSILPSYFYPIFMLWLSNFPAPCMSKITAENASTETYPWEPYQHAMFPCQAVAQKLYNKIFSEHFDDMQIRISCAYSWSEQKNYHKISDSFIRLRNIAKHPHIHIQIMKMYQHNCSRQGMFLDKSNLFY